MILSTVLISGCGFHLRGDYNVPAHLTTLSVTSHDEYSNLTRFVKSQLKINDIDLVAPSSTIPNLKLISENVSTQTMSVYQNTRSAENLITLNVNYQVTIPNIGTTRLTTSVNRSYLLNSLTALAKSVEKELLIDEMRQIAALQIIRQLARLEEDEPLQSDVLSQVSDNEFTTSTIIE
jgi:LPS-assembly lipoprotein